MKDIALRLDADEGHGELVQIAVGEVKSAPTLSHISMDVTSIAKYSEKIKQIGYGFNRLNAPNFIRDFSVAYDLTSNLLFEAMKMDAIAGRDLDIAESIAYLENASAYLTAKDIKDTAEARKRYVCIDPEVKRATELKAETAAILAFIKCKLQEFKTAIESVKKIAYGDTFMTPDEGI
jgi:hypothetical protein